jgi:hypothetical protein
MSSFKLVVGVCYHSHVSLHFIFSRVTRLIVLILSNKKVFLESYERFTVWAVEKALKKLFLTKWLRKSSLCIYRER